MLAQGPIRLPQYLGVVFDVINSAAVPPTPADIDSWCELLSTALSLNEAEREQVCHSISQQHQSETWYTERICRLTASKFGLICKRRSGCMSSLVNQLLYTDPPVHVTSLAQGRMKEPVVVKRYAAFKQKQEELVDISETGLHNHPEEGYLAASPDRLVSDWSCEPSSGLLEVKYLSSVNGKLVDSLKKSNFCLEDINGKLRFKQNHNYHYQVQGQMACAGRVWCDFACMAASGDLFVQRISFNPDFWNECEGKLRTVFSQHLAREIVYPGHAQVS